MKTTMTAEMAKKFIDGILRQVYREADIEVAKRLAHNCGIDFDECVSSFLVEMAKKYVYAYFDEQRHTINCFTIILACVDCAPKIREAVANLTLTQNLVRFFWKLDDEQLLTQLRPKIVTWLGTECLKPLDFDRKDGLMDSLKITTKELSVALNEFVKTHTVTNLNAAQRVYVIMSPERASTDPNPGFDHEIWLCYLAYVRSSHLSAGRMYESGTLEFAHKHINTLSLEDQNKLYKYVYGFLIDAGNCVLAAYIAREQHWRELELQAATQGYVKYCASDQFKEVRHLIQDHGILDTLAIIPKYLDQLWYEEKYDLFIQIAAENHIKMARETLLTAMNHDLRQSGSGIHYRRPQSPDCLMALGYRDLAQDEVIYDWQNGVFTAFKVNQILSNETKKDAIFTRKELAKKLGECIGRDSSMRDDWLPKIIKFTENRTRGYLNFLKLLYLEIAKTWICRYNEATLLTLMKHLPDFDTSRLGKLAHDKAKEMLEIGNWPVFRHIVVMWEIKEFLPIVESVEMEN